MIPALFTPYSSSRPQPPASWRAPPHRAAACAAQARSRRRPAHNPSASALPGSRGAWPDLPPLPPELAPPPPPVRPGRCRGRASGSPQVHRNKAPQCCLAAAGTHTAAVGWPSLAVFPPRSDPAGEGRRGTAAAAAGDPRCRPSRRRSLDPRRDRRRWSPVPQARSRRRAGQGRPARQQAAGRSARERAARSGPGPCPPRRSAPCPSRRPRPPPACRRAAGTRRTSRRRSPCSW